MVNGLTKEYTGYLLVGNEHERIYDIIQNGLLRARKYLWITSAKTLDFMVKNPNTKEAIQISQRLYRMAKQGIEQRFILAPREETKTYQNSKTVYQKLIGTENIQFKFCYDMHMKVIIVDGTWAYFGSANLTGAGMGSRTKKGRNNFEIGTITVDREAISVIEKLLWLIWSGDQCQGCYQKQKGYCKGIE